MTALKKYNSGLDFELENGKYIPDLQIGYHTFGELNSDKSNIIWVFHAISGNSDVLDWWPGLFGEGKYYDPSKYLIICANALGSPYGSTKPTDRNFPKFSMRDVVNAHFLLAAHLEITQIHTIIGGSFGGDQALEFAYSFSGKIEHCILVASCARESAWGIAIHESQRLAMESDPSFGLHNGGRDGMRAARSMALLTYRTSDSFIAQQTDLDEKVDEFSASSYMRYQGEKFVGRFDSLSYFYLTKCLDSHNIGRGRGGEAAALGRIKIPTLVIGIDTDKLIPPRFQKYMAEHIPNGSYAEIASEYGHDGFLLEAHLIAKQIQQFQTRLLDAKNQVKRVVLKFGGSSLVDERLPQVLQIVQKEAAKNSIALVVSARGKSTDVLLQLHKKALAGEDYSALFEAFCALQHSNLVTVDLAKEFMDLSDLLHTISGFRLDDLAIQDHLLSYGERISSMVLAAVLCANGLNGLAVDSAALLLVKNETEDVAVDLAKSQELTRSYFSNLEADVVPVVTGFYGKDAQDRIRTLGRNGTNYSATLIAGFIQALEVQNWTDVDGVYTADPRFVQNAKPIGHMSYREANELANFGVNVLHTKTILPLMKSNIPLRVLNVSKPNLAGTLIDSAGSGRGIKAVSIVNDVSLVRIEGKGLCGRIGIDGRIFSLLSAHGISVRIISQASSERGIGFVIDSEAADKTERLLSQEFAKELDKGDISTIAVDKKMAIIAIVGRHNFALEKAIKGLRKNKIWMHLISNSMSGEHISLVVSEQHIKKAVSVVHSHVFEAQKVIHVFAIGKGTVGNRFIDQILETQDKVVEERDLLIKVIGVADSKNHFINENGIGQNWRDTLALSRDSGGIQTILSCLKQSNLENIVVADNSSSLEITEAYPDIINAGFDLVASNKKGNSISQQFYTDFRALLKRKGRSFFYETNVGAGLPVIDTLKHLRRSADTVQRVRGVFSGSLSYLFNRYCQIDTSFTTLLLKAKSEGYTEPDPREDLSGMDVARKLIILARELGVKVEFAEVQIEGLIPKTLQTDADFDTFLEKRKQLDAHYAKIKNALKEHEVLRYVGDLDVKKNKLCVSLEKVDVGTPLGSLKNADSIFEIYTETYGAYPMVIQGAGAGAEVTARGVYSDLLRIGAL